jgi:DNA-binding transcriptional regulator YdaS (Cro superfamily)
MMIESAIDKAIRLAGGQRQLGQLLGVSYQAVQKMRRKIPAERVLAIESATGVSRHELRPDLYPPDEHRAA